jgi:hypothetical protein
LDITHELTLKTNNVITLKSPNSNFIKLNINASNGELMGSFVPAGSNVTNLIKGAVLQNLNQAAGCFLGQTNSGSVLITD